MQTAKKSLGYLQNLDILANTNCFRKEWSSSHSDFLFRTENFGTRLAVHRVVCFCFGFVFKKSRIIQPSTFARAFSISSLLRRLCGYLSASRLLKSTNVSYFTRFYCIYVKVFWCFQRELILLTYFLKNRTGLE